MSLRLAPDPAEWWQGSELVRAVFGTQTREMGFVRVTSSDLQAFASGDVGWVADTGIHLLANGVEVPIRITLVFERRGGEWKIVQWHASIGASNTETFGMELTTSIDVVLQAVEREKPNLGPSISSEGTVTILFTDIEGSTTLNESVGDMKWAEIVKAHDEFVRKTVDEHGGTTVERVGDGFMLAFPSARRSIECAIALQRDLPESQNASFRMRVGGHTGEPIREAGAFYGRAVAYAARVGAAAQGGEILVSSVMKELCAGSAFTFDGPREHEFKGFAGKQRIYAVDWS